MEPIHFLANQSLPLDPRAKDNSCQIDAFYAEHGRDSFVTISRCFATIRGALLRLRAGTDKQRRLAVKLRKA